MQPISTGSPATLSGVYLPPRHPTQSVAQLPAVQDSLQFGQWSGVDDFSPPVKAPWVFRASRWLASLNDYLLFSEVSFPEADKARLRQAAAPENVAIITPNHPAGPFDFVMDRMHLMDDIPEAPIWVNAFEFTRSKGPFFRRHKFINSLSREAGHRYALKEALKGHGVIVHPEGRISWSGHAIWPLYPGAARMALQSREQVRAGDRPDRPVNIVPVIWCYRYAEDISPRLDQRIDELAQTLGLPRYAGIPLEHKFAALLCDVFTRQLQVLKDSGIAIDEIEGLEGPVTPQRLFQLQGKVLDALVPYLLKATRIQPSEEVQMTLARIDRHLMQIDPVSKAQERERDRLIRINDEAMRLASLSPAYYNAPKLSQERLAEVLTQISRYCVESTMTRYRNRFGRMEAFVRVPEPIQVQSLEGETATISGLTQLLRDTMQQTLNHLRHENPTKKVFDNPLYNPTLAGPMLRKAASDS